MSLHSNSHTETSAGGGRGAFRCLLINTGVTGLWQFLLEKAPLVPFPCALPGMGPTSALWSRTRPGFSPVWQVWGEPVLQPFPVHLDCRHPGWAGGRAGGLEGESWCPVSLRPQEYRSGCVLQDVPPLVSNKWPHFNCQLLSH